MRDRLLGPLVLTAIVGSAFLASGCSSDTDTATAGSDGGEGSAPGTGSDAGSSGNAEAGGGRGTVMSGDGGTAPPPTKDGGGGTTPVEPTSTCAPAKVSLGVESVAKIGTGTDPDVGSILAVDLNNDGASDLVGIDRAGLDVALSKKDGTFGAPTSVSDPVADQGLAAGDFDGDGFQDVIVSSFGGGSDSASVDLLLGKGDGTFKLPVNTTVGSDAIDTLLPADFNADGKLDFYYDGQNGAGIVLNSGGAFAGATALDMTGLGDVLAFGDLNGDKAADIVYFDDGQNATCVGMNNGSGTFGMPACYPATANTSAGFIALGDVNGDGIQDIVILDLNGDSGEGTAINVYIGKAGGTFNDRVGYEFEFISSGMLVTDVNNDGKADLLVAETFDTKAQLDVYLTNADGTLPAMATATYPFGTPGGTTTVPVVEGDFAGNGLHGFATLNDLSGDEDVLTATCKP